MDVKLSTDTTCSRCGLRPKPIRRIDQPFPYTDPSASSTTRDELTSFNHDVEDVLLDCDAEIARVEDMLRLLKQERQAGESFLHLSPQLLRKGT